MFVCGYVHVCLGASKSREGVGFCRARVKGSCELTFSELRKELKFSGRAFLTTSHSSSPLYSLQQSLNYVTELLVRKSADQLMTQLSTAGRG